MGGRRREKFFLDWGWEEGWDLGKLGLGSPLMFRHLTTKHPVSPSPPSWWVKRKRRLPAVFWPSKASSTFGKRAHAIFQKLPHQSFSFCKADIYYIYFRVKFAQLCKIYLKKKRKKFAEKQRHFRIYTIQFLFYNFFFPTSFTLICKNNGYN